MYAVNIRFSIKPDRVEEFIPLVRANANWSLLMEPECEIADVCRHSARPDFVFVYEVYQSEAGFNLHRQSEHYKIFSVATDDMLLDKQVLTFDDVTR